VQAAAHRQAFRLQMFYGTNAVPQLTGSFCPTGYGNIMHRVYHFGLGTNDNGNVQSIDNCRDTARTANYTYDSLNRITQGNSTGPEWGDTYTVDAWGNLTNMNPMTGKTTAQNLQAAPASWKNRLNITGQGTDAVIDAAGNMTNDGNGHTYTYDAENRLTATAGWTYNYDADGRRVKKCNACTSASGGTLYWPGTGSDPLVESDLAGNLKFEYIFFNGQRVARRDGTSNPPYYYLADHLHSTTVVTDSTGVIKNESDYMSYGAEIGITSTLPQNYKFNGKERDSESGLDEFGARYYSSSLGRFMIPDWAAKPTAVPYANFGNPQSLNLYSYVENNPTTVGDPDGHAENFAHPYPPQGGVCGGACVPPPALDTESNPVCAGGHCSGGPRAEAPEAPDPPLQSDPPAAQNQPTSGEGSQANQSRREGIADAAVETKQRADLGQKQYGPNQCSAFVAGCISKAGAKAEFDNSGRPPVAGEWANKKANIPDWRPLGSKEKPAPGDVAAVHIRNPQPGATGDSAIVVRSGRGLSAIEAGSHGVEYNSLFIHGYRDVVYWRYTGD
jgi:RHS repeat-associated protein